MRLSPEIIVMRQYAFVVALLAVCTTGPLALADFALFDSPTDTISLNGNTTLGIAATYEARIQLRGAGGSIFSEWRIKEEDKLLGIANNSLTAYSYDINRPNQFSAPITLTPYQWYHVAYVFAGNQERLYLDGNLIALRGASGNIRDASFSLANLGGFVRENFKAGFIGLIDTFRVSSNARYAGTSFTPPQGDFLPDAYTQLLFNFTEPEGSMTVTDQGQNAVTGFLGAGFTGATAPTIIHVEPPIGDLDFDGFVGINDLNTVIGAWNQSVTPGDPASGDLTGDGFVGIDDLNLVLGNWNAGTPPGAPQNNSVIPEPATVALMGFGCALGTLNRKRYAHAE